MNLVHFVWIWYIFPVLASWTNKNLATLLWTPSQLFPTPMLVLTWCQHQQQHPLSECMLDICPIYRTKSYWRPLWLHLNEALIWTLFFSWPRFLYIGTK
jgi:hypothetical protein